MKKVLFPTDFSANAMNAFDYACHLSMYYKAKLFILNAYKVPAINSSMPVENLEKSSEDIQKNQLKRLEDFIHQYEKRNDSRDIHDLDICLHSLEGDTVKTISSFCDESDAHMVVMGTKGVGNKREEKIGSITGRVIHQVKCPVLAIPELCKFKAPKKIVFALDFEEDSVKPMKSLKEFADIFSAKIILLHIVQNKKYFNTAHWERYQDTLKKVSDYENVSFEFIQDEQIMESLDRYLSRNEIDLLAMTTHKRHLIKKAYTKSLTRKMVFHTDIPLLAFHD